MARKNLNGLAAAAAATTTATAAAAATTTAAADQVECNAGEQCCSKRGNLRSRPFTDKGSKT